MCGGYSPRGGPLEAYARMILMQSLPPPSRILVHVRPLSWVASRPWRIPRPPNGNVTHYLSASTGLDFSLINDLVLVGGNAKSKKFDATKFSYPL